MTTTATFTTDGEAFPLGALLAAIPEATVELERIIPTDAGVIPYVWVRDVDTEALERVLPILEPVGRIARVDSAGGRHLLRVEWAAEVDGLLSVLRDTGVTLLSMVGADGRWTIELRTETSAGVRAFQQGCADAGIPVHLTELHAVVPLDSPGDVALTGSQHEALLLAYRRGYFETPRACTLEELAAELDISGQAFGSRLQRGINRLVGATLASEQQP